MFDLELLTNESRYLLGLMYKEYLEKRKSGVSRDNASRFVDIVSIHEKLMPNSLLDDVESFCFELLKHEWIKGMRADGTVFNISLTTEAIATLEVNFKDRIDSVVDFLSKLKAIIPFI